MKLVITCLISTLISCFPAYGAARTIEPHPAPRHRVEYGMASWYGDREQGRLMACGKPFDEYAMVAAHRALPLGTTVRVTNLRNGRSVVVRIMDRGPRRADRAIDLSKAAAEHLRFIRQGVAPVRIRVLSLPNKHTREVELTRHAQNSRREIALSGDENPEQTVSSC